MPSELRDYVEARTRHLLQTCPGLSEIRLATLDTTSLSSERLSSFIEVCWEAHHGGTPRIRYTPGVIDEFLRPPASRGLSLAAFKPDGSLVGLGLGSERQMVLDGRRRARGVLHTGLSVDPNYAGHGVAGLIVSEITGLAIRRNIEVGFVWYDDRRKRPTSVPKVVRSAPGQKRATIGVWGKTFDYESAARYHQMNALESCAVRLLARWNRRRLDGVSQPCVEDVRGLSGVLDFYERCTRSTPLRQCFTDESLMDYLSPAGGLPPDHFMYPLSRGNQLVGLAKGIVSRTDADASIGYLDLVLLDKTLGFGEKQRFLRSVEKQLNEHHGCFAVVGIRPAFSENPLPFGYLPIDKQTIVMNELVSGVSISEKDLAGALVELR